MLMLVNVTVVVGVIVVGVSVIIVEVVVYTRNCFGIDVVSLLSLLTFVW